MISFDYPMLFLIVVLPIFVHFLIRPFQIRQTSVRVSFFNIVAQSFSDKQSLHNIRKRKTIQTSLLIVSWVLFCVALARPVMSGKEIVKNISSKSFYIALDLSGSMNFEDTQSGQTRLDVAKKNIVKFINERKDDYLGLVVFGDSAYLQAPLTNDRESLISLVNQSKVGMAGLSTHLGDAIGLGIKRFRGLKMKERVLVLLTDGNDTGSDIRPIDAAKIARSENIKIYVLGYGDPKTVGENSLDTNTLKEISRLTNGRFYLPSDEKQLEQAFKDISSIEVQEMTRLTFLPKYDLFFIPIVIILLIYLMTILIILIRRFLLQRSANV
ncbi:von Willebrand factor type A domain protein [Bacteriovorax sp. BAL6_X]|uniref:VWA domain-containing protein n=1 Tax=Bacteriovorax sp. BAL6_X TaxID=1201290 RepID=UPI000386DF60|nr:VWA domain-containing protein [Bacteriovorax sp. BAL6_X]EPZ50643.1 von Willebrand factor type A domain protein [Bacteriovorax sp. BAL6_X]